MFPGKEIIMFSCISRNFWTAVISSQPCSMPFLRGSGDFDNSLGRYIRSEAKRWIISAVASPDCEDAKRRKVAFLRSKITSVAILMIIPATRRPLRSLY